MKLKIFNPKNLVYLRNQVFNPFNGAIAKFYTTIFSDLISIARFRELFRNSTDRSGCCYNSADTGSDEPEYLTV